MNAQQYAESGKYLPEPLRDFHDQKEVFKAMHAIVAVEKHEYAKQVSWIVGQCYVIDIFLWFMAKRGWTLQRSRADVEFLDLGADIKAMRDAEQAIFKRMLDERLQQDGTVKPPV